VEHDGCKVLIIANENEIANGDDYRKRREKLIGKTLEIQSAFEEAFTHFVSLIDFPEARSLFEKNAAEIAFIYQQSTSNNLRILQQTMWDFERFSQALTEVHRQNQEAMTALLRFVFALSIELKSGQIKSDDLISRMSKLVGEMARRETGEASRLTLAGRRYPEIDLNDSIISDELLVDILVKGIIDGDAIRSSLDKSRYFVTSADEPAWRTVWHWFERADDKFAVAYEKMEQQFAAREFSITGEVLHVFGLRLFLSGIGVLGETREEVVAKGKEYVDDLYAEKRLELLPPDDFSVVRFGGYGGLGIHENETAEYREFFTYLQTKGRQAAEDAYPAKAIALLKEMDADAQLFYRRVCISNSGDTLYSSVPILASIDPDVFVTSLLKLHPADQRVVMMAIKARYEHGSLERDLATEKPWLVLVQDKLKQRAAGMVPIARYRLLQNAELHISSVLGNSRSGP
jgi:hypothetical protein